MTHQCAVIRLRLLLGVLAVVNLSCDHERLAPVPQAVPPDLPFALKWDPLFANFNDITALSEQDAWAVGSGGLVVATSDGGRSWSPQPSGTAVSLHDVQFVDMRHGWIVGDEGLILATADGGMTWSRQQSGSDMVLRAVRFLDGQNGWAVGENATILATTDGGSTWTRQSCGTLEDLSDIHFVDPLNGWAVGGSYFSYWESPAIFCTSDGGKRWKSHDLDREGYKLNSVCFADALTGWACGGDGTILFTSDGGKSWTDQHSGTGENLYTVDFVNASVGWATGDKGTILHTLDGGKSWLETSAGADLSLASTDFTDRMAGWAVSTGGTILSTTDSGRSWRENRHGMDLNLKAVWSVGERTISAIADNGTVLASDDAAQSWRRVSTGQARPHSFFQAAWFVDARTGWVVGNDGLVLHTADGGKSWVEQSNSPRFPLRDIHAVDARHCWAAGDGGTVLASVDGGRSWTRRESGLRDGLRAAWFVDTQRGWVAGGGGNILVTVDGGKSWTEQNSGTTASMNALCFTDAQSGWAVGGKGTILATSDGGRSWTKEISHTTAMLHALCVCDDTGWACGDNGEILVRTDRDRSWRLQDSGTGERLHAIHFFDAQTGWAAGGGGTILATTDGGESWIRGRTGTDQTVLSLQFIDAQTGWATGSDFTIATIDGGKTWDTRLRADTSVESLVSVGSREGWIVGQTGLICATTDGGKSWVEQESGTNKNLWAASFVNKQTGWVVGNKGTVLATTDGGGSWIRRDCRSEENLDAVCFIDPRTGWVAGANGTIIATIDGGKSWIRQESGVRTYVRAIFFVDERAGWAVGDEGTVLATVDGGASWTRQESGTLELLRTVYFNDGRMGWVGGDNGTILATIDGGKTWARQSTGTRGAVNFLAFAEPRVGLAVGWRTILRAQRADDGPCLATFSASCMKQGVMLRWAARDESLGSVACSSIEFRQGHDGDWRKIAWNHPPMNTNGEFTFEWTPASIRHLVAPGTTLYYRVTLRDQEGLFYTQEVPTGFVYRPWWDRQPAIIKAIIIGAAVAGAYLTACVLLYLFRPDEIARLHSVLSRQPIYARYVPHFGAHLVGRVVTLTGLDALARTRRVRLAWAKRYMEERSELSDLAALLRTDYLEHADILDAWVARHQQSATNVFGERQTVKSRLVRDLPSMGLAPSPLTINGRTEEEPTLEPLRSVFEKTSLRLLIQGEGGTGKTTLACLLAIWALSPRSKTGLSPHTMLPLLIENELPPCSDPFRQAIRCALLDLVGSGGSVSDELLDALLRERRLLVIVDHLSEMSWATRAAIQPNRSDLPINALIVTSRAADELNGIITDRIEVMKIDGDRLSRFLDAYLTRRGRRDLFTDAEYEPARRRLANMLGRSNRSIPVLFPKLYADRLVASKEVGDDAVLPLSIPELMAHYVVDQNRNVAGDNRLPDAIVNRSLEAVAWECLRREFRPMSAPWGDALAALTAVDGAEGVLGYLVDQLHILRRDDLTGELRFGLDPLAEYLAARDRVERCGSELTRWRAFLTQADEAGSRPPLARTQSFLYAVWDCVVSPRERTPLEFEANSSSTDGGSMVPEEVVVEIGKRTGIAETSLRLIEGLKFRNLIDSLTSKVVLILGRFSPQRKSVLDAAWDELRRLGYMPVLFDFDKPSLRDRTETATLLAYLSRFMVVDITDARSVRQELQAILPILSVPVRPILDHRDREGSYSLFDDFAKYPWVLLPVFVYDDQDHLVRAMKAEVVDRAEEWIRSWSPSHRQGSGQ